MHITQSPQWARFRANTPNIKKVIKIGSWYVYVHKIPCLPFTVAYLPRPDGLDNLDEIKKICCKENVIFLKVEPVNGQGGQGKNILPRHTIYIDLTKSEEALLKAMHEKTRYNIRLAEKRGVVIKQSQNLEEFIALLSKTELRQGFYSHNPNYYRQLWEIIKPHLLTAYVNNISVASIMLFEYQDFLYYPYGGSDPQYKEYMAPHLLHWEAMKLGKKLGCKIYDLWGSYKEEPEESDPWWGIYRFKSGFGGNEVDFPQAIDIPLSPLYPLFILADQIRWFFLKHGPSAK